MLRSSLVVESDKPTYQILKWIGGGGFGQVFKVLRDDKIAACKQIQFDNVDAALDEYEHMALLQGGPHIAKLHRGLEYNNTTNTLSFFMDYYKGKDLDRQVQVLRGAGEQFSESQIVEIGFQIAIALEYCHSRNVLHQDIKLMNVLLLEPWNPLVQNDVPDLYVADFGIASHAQTIGTRFTAQRGTPGYEAPEVREQGAFSQKSDIFAFGCILYRLCTLQDPEVLDDVKPLEISPEYSIGLLSLVSSMLSSDRADRPIASVVKQQLADLAYQFFASSAKECRVCGRVCPSQNALRKHLKKTGHHQKEGNHRSNYVDLEPISLEAEGFGSWADYEPEFKIKGVAESAFGDENEEPLDASPCVVCMRHFNSKKRFFQHLHHGRHYRNAGYVLKRRAENDPNIDASKHMRI